MILESNIKGENIKYINFNQKLKQQISKVMYDNNLDYTMKQNILVMSFMFEHTFEEIMHNYRNYLMSYDNLDTQQDLLQLEKSQSETAQSKQDLLNFNVEEYYELILDSYDKLRLSKEQSISDLNPHQVKTAAYVICKYFRNLKDISLTRYKNFQRKHKIVFFGIELNKIKGVSLSIKKSRLCDYSFVKRKLVSLHKKHCEFDRIKTGEVGLKTHYASESSVKRKLREEEIGKMYFENKQLFNIETGDTIPLSQIIEKQNEKKAAELLTVSKGLENLAEEQGYTWRFITLTCPSKFHRITHVNGQAKLNKGYKYLDPSESAKFLQDRWTKIRKQCHNRNIDSHGMYCSEPHKDGTLHRHYMTYAAESSFLPVHLLKRLEVLQNKKSSKKTLGEYRKFINILTEKYPDTYEVQVLKYFKFSLKAVKFEYTKMVYSDFKKKYIEAKPTTYILKYIMKSLGIESFEGNEVENTDYIRTTASIFKYRRYDFFGLKSVMGLYRMFCKIKDKDNFARDLIECPYTLKALDSVNYKDEDKGENYRYTNFAEFYKNIILADIEKVYEELINKYGECTKKLIGLDTIINQEDIKITLNIYAKQKFEILESY